MVKQKGLCTEYDYPYKGKDEKCTASGCHGNDRLDQISSYQDVSPSESSLQAAVSQQPVSIAVEADKDIFHHYPSGVVSGDCGTKLDHGVLVVGYGSDLDSGKDFWKVK